MAENKAHHSVHTVSAIDLFPKSYEIVRKNIKLFALVYSVSIATALIAIGQRISDHNLGAGSWQSWISSSVAGPDLNFSSMAGLGILVAIFSIIGVVFALMQVVLVLRTAQDKTPDFDALWTEFKKKGLRLLLLVICMVLALIVGFILLIIPGIILLWRLSMAPYVMVDQNTNISESFVRSWEMTKGYGWSIYSIYLFAIVLGIANLVPLIGGLLGLGLAIAYSVAIPLRYVEIRKHS
jgi:hypothetical protein